MNSSVQTVGRFLSRMVMPNISAFIAWGIITTLFHRVALVQWASAQWITHWPSRTDRL